MNDLFPGEGRKKITSLFSNERRYNRNGSITTATIDKEDTIRHSRIMNLPSYKKQTLGCRLDFVVVFQTIEIERLSLQIESLRVKLVDSERQIFNYKNYEVQIRELNERCFKYEKERSQFQEEIALLNMELKNAKNGHVDYKDKCMMLEDALREKEDYAFQLREKLIIQQKNREQSEEGRLQLESSIKQKEKFYSRQIQSFQKSTQLRKKEPNKHEQHLNNLLKKYHEEVNTLQKQNIALRDVYDAIEQQSRQLQRKYQELQEQLYRNNESLKQKQFQLQNVEQQNRERMEMMQIRYEDEYNDKCKRVEECEREIVEWKNQVDRLEIDQEKYQLKISEYCQQGQRYQSLLNQAGDQIDRLNTIIKDKIKYLEAWQGRYKDVQNNFNSAEATINVQNQKIASDQEQIMRITQALKLKTSQLDKLERNREQQVIAIKEKLQQIQIQRQEIATIKREKELERDDQRMKQLENTQLKEQLNKRIVQGNKLFQDLNKTEALTKQIRIQLAASQASLRIKDEELQKAKDEIDSVDHRIEKLQGEKRALQQQVMRVKALEERIRHEEAKKNQYLSQGKKVNQKLNQSEKQLGESRRKRKELQTDLQKFKNYTEQLEAKVQDLQEKVSLVNQLQIQISYLLQVNQKNEQQIQRLQENIADKTNQIGHCKQKIVIFDRLVKEFKHKEAAYKQELQKYVKLQSDIKHLKKKYEDLEDKNDQLESELTIALNENDQLNKEKDSLQRVISINNQEQERSQKLLVEAKEDIQFHKGKQKEFLAKLYEAEKKYKHIHQDIQKQKDRLAREKGHLEKMLERRTKEFQHETRSMQNEKEKLIHQKQKESREHQEVKKQMEDQNNSFRLFIKKYQEEKDKLHKYSKELEKKVLSYEHELERTAQSGSETKKQLEISRNKIQKMSLKVKQTDELIKEQAERIGQLLTDKEKLLAEVSDQERTTTSKQQDIVQLERQNQMFQNEISMQNEQIENLHEKDRSLSEEFLKVKFQAANIQESYLSLKARMNNVQRMILQLKEQQKKTIQMNSKLERQKKSIENKYVQYQEKLTNQVQRLEELQFKSGEQIIRLDTMNKILQIQIGQYKERQIAVFSIVKEGSVLKERIETTPLKEKDRKTPELKNLQSPSKKTSTNVSNTFQNIRQSKVIKSLIFEQANQMLQSRSNTIKQEDDAVEISYCQKRDSFPSGQHPPQKSNSNQLYFQNLGQKPI